MDQQSLPTSYEEVLADLDNKLKELRQGLKNIETNLKMVNKTIQEHLKKIQDLRESKVFLRTKSKIVSLDQYKNIDIEVGKLVKEIKSLKMTAVLAEELRVKMTANVQFFTSERESVTRKHKHTAKVLKFKRKKQWTFKIKS